MRFSLIALVLSIFLVLEFSGPIVQSYSVAYSNTALAWVQNSSNSVTALSGAYNAYWLGLSNGYVYWYDWSNNGEFIRILQNGTGGAHPIVEGIGTEVNAIAIEGNTIYWAQQLYGSYYLNATNVLNGKTKILHYDKTGEDSYDALAVNSKYVFVSDYNGTGYFYVDRLALSGSGFKRIMQNSGASFDALSMVVSGTTLYMQSAGGYVGKVPIAGGKLTLLSKPVSSGTVYIAGVQSLIVVGKRLYWTFNDYNSGNAIGYLSTVSTSGKGFHNLVVASTVSNINPVLEGIAYYNNRIIFSYVEGTQSIQSIPLSGGKNATIASGVPGYTMKVQGSNLYFAAVSSIDVTAA